MEEGKEKERKKIAMGRSVSLGLDLSCWLYSGLQLLGAIIG
jgi:hypothetical protein